jgi:cytochrome b
MPSPITSEVSSDTRSLAAWDAPVRIFHWTLALLMVFSVATGLTGGNAMVWHMRSGYAILTLVVFRVLWGFVGSTTARFSDFLYGPGRALAFVRDVLGRRPAHYLGHNPVGGWMVLLLLILILAQAGTGLFANDDISTEGPLYRYVSKDFSDQLTGLHKLNVKILYGLVALHIAAVLYHLLWRGENLVRAMFTGFKETSAGEPGNGLRFSSSWLALGLFIAVAVCVYFLVSKPT